MKTEKRNLPKFVKMSDSRKATVLRLTSDFRDNTKQVYHKDAGGWSVDFDFKNKKMVSVHSFESLNNLELIPATKREWFLDNEQYISEEDLILDKDDFLKLIKGFLETKNIKKEFFEYVSEQSDYLEKELKASFKFIFNH